MMKGEMNHMRDAAGSLLTDDDTAEDEGKNNSEVTKSVAVGDLRKNSLVVGFGVHDSVCWVLRDMGSCPMENSTADKSYYYWYSGGCCYC